MLHLMGLQVPEELPGRVLTEAIRPSVLADFPVSMVAGALPLPPVNRIRMGPPFAVDVVAKPRALPPRFNP